MNLLILASQSPRRAALLAEAGFAFRVAPADVDETPPPGMRPSEVATELARRKARAVAARHSGGVVLGADTVVALGVEILGKPTDRADAERILAKLSGTRHEVITGVCLIDSATGREQAGSVATWVTMRPMTREEIAAYAASGEADGKAGAYAIQETADRFVEALEGSFSNVVGLPMEKLAEMLKGFGIEPSRS